MFQTGHNSTEKAPSIKDCAIASAQIVAKMEAAGLRVMMPDPKLWGNATFRKQFKKALKEERKKHDHTRD